MGDFNKLSNVFHGGCDVKQLSHLRIERESDYKLFDQMCYVKHATKKGCKPCVDTLVLQQQGT
jgi:hypothetical protein